MKKTPTLKDLGEMLAHGMNIRADIVPIIDEDSENLLLNVDNSAAELPVLPVMDQVLLPGVVLPIVVRREKSLRLLHDAQEGKSNILVHTQLNDNEEPAEADLCAMGVVARVMKVFEVKKNISVAILQGMTRSCPLVLTQREPYMKGMVQLCPESDEGTRSVAFKRKVKKLRKQYSDLMAMRIGEEEGSDIVANIGSDKIFLNFVASHLETDVEVKCKLLEANTYTERLDMLLEQMASQRGLEELKREIESRTQDVIGKQQREYFLRNQLNVIQEELGHQDDDDASWKNNPELSELAAKAEKAGLTEEVRALFDKELKKLSHIPNFASEYTVQYNYLETLLEVPWQKQAEGKLDIGEARRVLDRDHYGIKKVKERIVEYLAVMKRVGEKGGKEHKAQVLCLVGPPGTGKTSICRSIATAMGRPYRRIALGGLHDEAEIRGHRRTYVGAMPGRIVQELVKAGVNNPVFVLDEIDKVQHSSYSGDPTSALLEVLDPEQNSHFHDNFLGMDVDLSHVFFIATANSLGEVPAALVDRMEVIAFSGYVQEEKLEIAKRHLLPRIAAENCLDRRTMRWSDEVIAEVINSYTREGGVRQLEKQLSKVVRHRVVQAESGEKQAAAVSQAEVKEVLGLPIHTGERLQREPREGVVAGLAWTPVGGELLFIESSVSHGKGSLSLTGNLGEVMKESATLAFTYIKANAERFGISEKEMEKSAVHIHVPEGATPKDGPSAGITMFVAMVSALSHRKVNPRVAMTGEITLRGEVTPIGGVKEKLLAARRAGITDVLLCTENRRDVEEIEPEYLQGLTFHYIEEISEALPLALVEEKPKKAPRK
ncbi:MAG: endopeptidase La [Bacteroidales bacterium]|nr:endopeptidase La [Bacteroidales bacterium]